MPGHPAISQLVDSQAAFSLILLHQQRESELHQLIPLAIGQNAGNWDEQLAKFSKTLVVYSNKVISPLLQFRVRRKWPLLQISFISGGHPAGLFQQAHSIISDGGWYTLEAILAGRNVQQSHSSVFTALCNSSGDERQLLLQRLVHQLFQLHSNIMLPHSPGATLSELFHWLSFQQQQLSKIPSTLYVHRMARLWRPVMRRFAPYSTLKFVRHGRQVPAGASLLLWGRRECDTALAAGVSVLRVEDGFVRSVGLGAQFVPPVSWVFDDLGIYFDSQTESALERVCNQVVFSQAMLQRATALQQQIVSAHITKYNTGTGQWLRPAGRTVVLVPGQVETDASIRYGAAEIRQNLALLKAVRLQRPDAYLVYKPHPDVVAKARASGEGEHSAAEYCDEVITDIGMAQLLTQVDEVHVLTSLTGFEALLRAIPVYCYGRPFYAGWGLTVDQVPQLRRQRSLTLPQLVAATLIMYPTYVSVKYGCYTTAENSLNELAAMRSQQQFSLAGAGRRALRVLVNLLVKPA
nr:hypothetical protein [Rheinheimera maricola]